MKSKSKILLAIGGALGLFGCAADPIRTNPGLGGPDAGGGLPDAGPVSNRVTEGLAALYEFDGVAGQTVVNDTSGAGIPLDLNIGNPLAVTWGLGSLNVVAPVVIQSIGAATKIYQACAASNEVSVEAWVRPATLDGTGRVVSNAANADTRNFQLKQENDYYQVRVRTSLNAQGVNPDSMTALGTATIAAPQHVLYTRNAIGQADVYVNNVKQAPYSNGGTQAVWDPNYTLTIANEPTADRPFLGELYLVAVYCRALSPAEIAQNYNDGY